MVKIPEEFTRRDAHGCQADERFSCDPGGQKKLGQMCLQVRGDRTWLVHSHENRFLLYGPRVHLEVGKVIPNLNRRIFFSILRLSEIVLVEGPDCDRFRLLDRRVSVAENAAT
ncbi:MAG: hypothetical protein SFZ23_07135 [Planctomycetota bacterium]|nr:hypothetical protein [Planctomycetota bacterium]